MKRIDIAIISLSIGFAVILLTLLYIFFGDRLRTMIKATVHAMPDEAHRGPGADGSSLIDYDSYSMTFKERIASILTAGVSIFAVGYVFYRSILISMCLVPLALVYPKLKIKSIIRKRKNELNQQFREALYSVASSLSAGRSIESSFRDSQKELSIQYPDNETYILKELEQINKRIDMNETIEEALADFAARSHLEDIANFAEVFGICKRTGGNLVQVVRNTAEIISEKIDVKQEINVLLTEKKLEHKMLNIMPVIIILLLSASAEDFMSPVFTEPIGRAAMTFSLMLFTIAYFVSKKIMDIEV